MACARECWCDDRVQKRRRYATAPRPIGATRTRAALAKQRQPAARRGTAAASCNATRSKPGCAASLSDETERRLWAPELRACVRHTRQSSHQSPDDYKRPPFGMRHANDSSWRIRPARSRATLARWPKARGKLRRCRPPGPAPSHRGRCGSRPGTRGPSSENLRHLDCGACCGQKGDSCTGNRDCCTNICRPSGRCG